MHTSECLTERRTVFLQIEILRHSYCRHLSPSLYLILSKLFPKTLHTSWIHGANEHDLRSHSIPPDSSTHGYVMDMQIPFFMTVRTRKQNKTNNAVITTNGSQTRKRTLPKKKKKLKAIVQICYKYFQQKWRRDLDEATLTFLLKLRKPVSDLKSRSSAKFQNKF